MGGRRMLEKRMEALRALLRKQGLDAVIVTKEVNLMYFSGFRGDDTMLVVTPARQFLITDNRYTEQARQQAPRYELVEQKHGLTARTAELLAALGAKRIGFEGKHMTYQRYRDFASRLPECTLTGDLDLDALRQIKDAGEIAKIRKACEIADAAYEDVLSFLRPGVTEFEVAAHMEGYMRAHGSEGPSFAIIVASGKRGALPHGTPTQKVIEEGDFVTMDYGAIYEGYHSDITRTLCVGRASERQRETYAHVLEAQELALTLIKPGASGKAVDAAVRQLFARYGLDAYFGHGLGHSLGLEIHEEPRLSPHSTCEHLAPGMLITDEPGVYFADWGGLRIEDTVLVTEQGSEALTKATKKLIEII